MEYLRSLTEDTHLVSITPIETPIELKRRIVNDSPDLVLRTRQEIRDILHGQDNRRLLVDVGPCSVHNPKIAIEYAEKLSPLRRQLEDDLVIVMRTYLEKPRTTVGWTGLVYDPHLDGSSDAGKGLAVSRQILADVNKLGVPCAVEFLDPFTPQYFGDLVSWAAIGARTTESQIHRQLASGLSMPVGFKNSTEGNSNVAIDAMVAAASSHTFFGIDTYGRVAAVKTTGNPDTHLVLRGSSKGPNYDETSVNEAIILIQKRGLLTESNRPVMIDCSHGNSAKDHRRQLSVAENVLKQFQSGQQRIMGMMIESNLQEGHQKWVAGKQLNYGVSITDACIGWEETKRLLLDSAQTRQPKKYVLA